MVVALFGDYFDLMGIKAMLIILVFIAFCAVFYEADWKQHIFFRVELFVAVFNRPFFPAD